MRIRLMHKTLKKQQGLSLAAALFIVVGAALLVSAIAQMVEVNALSYEQEILSNRAFYTAESGAQLAANRLLVGGSCAAATLSFTQVGLNNCNAAITCDTHTVNITDFYYTITSIGSCGSGDRLASRTVQVRADD